MIPCEFGNGGSFELRQAMEKTSNILEIRKLQRRHSLSETQAFTCRFSVCESVICSANS
jgi:hypothetical protein